MTKHNTNDSFACCYLASVQGLQLFCEIERFEPAKYKKL